MGLLVTAEILPSLKHITPTTCTASSARCVSNRRGEVVAIVCGHPCAVSLPCCHNTQNGSPGVTAASVLSTHWVKKLLLWKVAEKLQSWVKRAGSALLMEVKALVCSSISRSDCLWAGSRFAARFCFIILFHFILNFSWLVFTPVLCLNRFRGIVFSAPGVNITQGNLREASHYHSECFVTAAEILYFDEGEGTITSVLWNLSGDHYYVCLFSF